MKKLLIVSDSHGNKNAVYSLEKIVKECDFVIHLGDGERDIHVFDDKYKDKIYSVLGNCDGGGEDLTLFIEDSKILLTHGDRHGVRFSLLRLNLYAKEEGCNIVFYGHTHRAGIVTENGVTMINPGTMSNGATASYCYAEINGGMINAKIVNL